MEYGGVPYSPVLGKVVRRIGEICPLRINEFALEYGVFLKTSFWELVFGDLVLGVPIL